MLGYVGGYWRMLGCIGVCCGHSSKGWNASTSSLKVATSVTSSLLQRSSVRVEHRVKGSIGYGD